MRRFAADPTCSATCGCSTLTARLPDRPLVGCAVAPRVHGADALVPAHTAGRLFAGHALMGTLPAAVALLMLLDAAGDVKATASALSLHRRGLCCHLRRIEELTGLRLDDGGDCLLAHLAVRLSRLR